MHNVLDHVLHCVGNTPLVRLNKLALGLEANVYVKLEMLNPYSKMAIEKGRVRIQPHKAIVGQNAFLRPMYVWAGINMAKESWMLHEPLSPELVGTSSTVVFGPGSIAQAHPADEWIAIEQLEAAVDILTQLLVGGDLPAAWETP